MIHWTEDNDDIRIILSTSYKAADMLSVLFRFQKGRHVKLDLLEKKMYFKEFLEVNDKQYFALMNVNDICLLLAKFNDWMEKAIGLYKI